MKELTIGTRVYYTGDMANHAYFGTITGISRSKWGDHYEITPDADSDREPHSIPVLMFSETYSGNGSTRHVTEEAYKAYRTKQIAQMETEYKALLAR